jgi:methylase of polypeptide subunit release factors
VQTPALPETALPSAPRLAEDDHDLLVDDERRTAFVGRLEIGWDPRILEPRPWTAEQSRWAARLLTTLPDGPVLELCSGAGHIGLLAVAGTRRELVCVDRDPVATAYAADNAARNGLAHQVVARTATIEQVADEPTGYALVLADPPWVPSAGIGRFPDDPPGAIDGGPEGTDLAVACVRTASRVLLPGGALVLQVGTVEQATGVVADAAAAHGLTVEEVRPCVGGVLVLLR